jgi:pimeloyl-ACP methyl ester carboxylesterase
MPASRLRHDGLAARATGQPALASLAHQLLTRDDRLPLVPYAVSAARHPLPEEDGLVARYYAAPGQAKRPLVLLHGVHAVASSRDVAPLFDAFRGRRPVYALDLPGFGASDRSRAATRPEVMERAILRMLRCVYVPGGADVIALSLSSEYAARVAVEHPELVHALVLISPTGFKLRSEMGRVERAARTGAAHPGAHGRLDRVLYRLLTSRPCLRHFLARSFRGPCDARLYAYALATRGLPGAEHAPRAFARGALFPMGDPLGNYGRVQAPTLVVHGEGGSTRYGSLRTFVRWNPHFSAEFVPHTGNLPHYEAPERVAALVDAHFDQAEQTRDGAAPGLEA